MIERVAEALHNSATNAPEVWKYLGKLKHDEWVDLARSAIEAIRKPDRAMIVAGATAMNQRKFGCPPDDELDAVRVYERMIDAA